jgi:uncharacterized SAM-binding protein YcdF (DUF218 family)
MTFLRKVWSLTRALLALAGLGAVLLVVLAFTPYPWRVYMWLNAREPLPDREPDFIVVLGGGGIPSETGLMRTYAAADEARRHGGARVIVALPRDGVGADSSLGRMLRELEMRGVGRDRFLEEDSGRNTREQALNVRALLRKEGGPWGRPEEPFLLIVTSPDHMRRAVLSFRKAGFAVVRGAGAFGTSVNADLTFDVAEMGATPPAVPDVGDSMALRYVVWGNLSLEGKIARELAALGYYKAMGWI